MSRRRRRERRPFASNIARGAGSPMQPSRRLVPPRTPARSGGLFVGRLVAERGTATLMEALDLFPGARVDVIGAGPDHARLAAHARIRVPGPVSRTELQERMRLSAYLILPSLSYEALPRPLIEAFANGV